MGFFSAADRKVEAAANKVDRALGLSSNIGSVWGTKKTQDKFLTRDEQKAHNEAEQAGQPAKRNWW
jgi:hypothetical protein